MHLAHENWTLKDHQPNVRKDYKDLSRPKKTGISTQSNWVFL